MYKLWAKKIKNNKIISSLNIKNDENLSPLEKREKCFKEICQKFDISVPLWLSKHNFEFNEFKYVTFYPNDFIDEIDFDKLEIEMIDDGKKNKK
ncbi:hypothetical protein [Sedimentibacter sp. MB31-C6]|uniref:hypothetical protein n=1 Tax=Sedimentibacter sp. MB31-C6 TaxID=3109366 RepID=UPI002DDD3F05|nr:hypothetical protein [Sedimentibacter sp. MB36-C1]WSI05175.1 hypothetical protein U8307_05125 [Sedimentibacter sp. MB36-C1]